MCQQNFTKVLPQLLVGKPVVWCVTAEQAGVCGADPNADTRENNWGLNTKCAFIMAERKTKQQ